MDLYFFLSLSYLCSQCVHKALPRRWTLWWAGGDLWNSLMCPPWSRVARGISHCILFSRCWMHFRTIFLSQTEMCKAILLHPLTFMSLPQVEQEFLQGWYFLCFWGKISLFALSHTGCYLWLCGYAIHDPAPCLEFATGLSESGSWRTFIGVNTNFPDLSWLILTICWNKSL